MVTLYNKVSLPKNISLTFKSDDSTFRNNVSFTGSGTASVTFTNGITVTRFGKKNITFTQSMDNVFTLKPNAWDQYVDVDKETATDINVLLYDTDANAPASTTYVKTPSIVSNPKHGTITGSFGAGDGTITYPPVGNFVGQDKFTFKVNDTVSDSDIKTVYITIKQ